MTDIAALRAEFVRTLTTDGSHDRRRKDFNYAVFDKDEGWSIWTVTDLSMVMEAFDHAVRNMAAAEKAAKRRREDVFDIDHMSMDDD